MSEQKFLHISFVLRKMQASILQEKLRTTQWAQRNTMHTEYLL